MRSRPHDDPAPRATALLRPMLAALSCLLAAALPGRPFAQDISSYRGACDASAAVALDAEHFAVGNDENNVLHVYRRGRPQPVGALDLSKFLGLRGDAEADHRQALPAWVSASTGSLRTRATAVARLMQADIASSPPSCCRASRRRCGRSACPTRVCCTISRQSDASEVIAAGVRFALGRRSRRRLQHRRTRGNARGARC